METERCWFVKRLNNITITIPFTLPSLSRVPATHSTEPHHSCNASSNLTKSMHSTTCKVRDKHSTQLAFNYPSINLNNISTFRIILLFASKHKTIFNSTCICYTHRACHTVRLHSEDNETLPCRLGSPLKQCSIDKIWFNNIAELD